MNSGKENRCTLFLDITFCLEWVKDENEIVRCTRMLVVTELTTLLKVKDFSVEK